MASSSFYAELVNKSTTVCNPEPVEICPEAEVVQLSEDGQIMAVPLMGAVHTPGPVNQTVELQQQLFYSHQLTSGQNVRQCLPFAGLDVDFQNIDVSSGVTQFFSNGSKCSHLPIVRVYFIPIANPSRVKMDAGIVRMVRHAIGWVKAMHLTAK